MKHIKKFEESLHQLDYNEAYYFDIDEFNKTHERERFGNDENIEIKKLFSNIEINDDYIDDDSEISKIHMSSGRKSIIISKFIDEWYTITYINPAFGYEKYWICDQIKGLIDCLSTIKNKDIDFR